MHEHAKLELFIKLCSLQKRLLNSRFRTGERKDLFTQYRISLWNSLPQDLLMRLLMATCIDGSERKLNNLMERGWGWGSLLFDMTQNSWMEPPWLEAWIPVSARVEPKAWEPFCFHAPLVWLSWKSLFIHCMMQDAGLDGLLVPVRHANWE